MLDGSSGEGKMAVCEVCETQFEVCGHRRCGDDSGAYIVTHSECDEMGCGECMNGCSDSSWEDYCIPCAIDICNDAAADRYTRRAENGFRD